MWASIGYQLVGKLVGGFAAAVLFWALFGDRLQGGHKRARCPKCGYDLHSVAAASNTSNPALKRAWTCPECGRAGRGAAGLYRSRKRWTLASLMAVCVAIGTGLSIAPLLRGGQWKHHLPVLWHARLEPVAAANFRLQEMLSLIKSGTLSASSRALLRSTAEACILANPARFRRSDEYGMAILTGLGERSAAEDALAMKVLSSADGSAVDAAIGYFKSGSTSSTELFDLLKEVLDTRSAANERHLIQAIAELRDRDPRAMPYLFKMAFEERSTRSSDAERAISALRQSERFALMMEAITRLDGTERLLPMLNAAWITCMARDAEGELAYSRWALTSLAKMGPEVDDLWFDSFLRSIEHDSNNELYALALRLPVDKSIRPLRELAMRSGHPMPEGVFDRLLPDAPLESYTQQDLQLIRFAPVSRHDRLIAAAAAHPPTRRKIWVVSALPGKAAPKLAFLRRVEADLTTTEECRVAARDALRYLGEWTDKPASPK